jgi:hypothetical protein
MWFLIVTLYVLNRVPTTETFGPFPTVYYCEEELIRQMNRIERLPGARAAAAHCEIEM